MQTFGMLWFPENGGKHVRVRNKGRLL